MISSCTNNQLKFLEKNKKFYLALNLLIMQQFDFITMNPLILGGKPCIKGTRISVEFILELIASGASIADIVKNYPHLTEIGVKQAIEYATSQLKNDVVFEVNH